MSLSRHGLRLAAFAFAGAFFIASPADAQIPGRLKKLGKDMVKNKLGGKDSSSADSTPAAKTGGSSTSSAGPDYAITDARISAVLTALGPAVQYAQLSAAAAAEREPHRARTDKFTACVQGATQGNVMPNPANAEAAQKYTTQMEAVSQRANAALAANDRRKYIYANDSVIALTSNMTATMFGLTGKCGTYPFTPKALIEYEIAKAADHDGGSSGMVTVASPTTQQLSKVQFGMIRERIALWTMMKSGTPVNTLGKQGVFTEAELAALDARSAEVMKLAPLFKGKTLNWNGTSDLSGW